MSKMTWFVQPETVIVKLPDDHWLDLKKRLTIGESHKQKASLVLEVRSDGRVSPDMEMMEKAEIMAYLVDWSLVDLQGKRIPIDTDAKKLAAISGLTVEAFKVISDAVTGHVAAMEAAREAEKKQPAGESASSATLQSVAT